VAPRRPLVFFRNALEDFFPVDRHISWRIDPEANFIAFHIKHRDRDLVPDLQALADPPRQNQHPFKPPRITLLRENMVGILPAQSSAAELSNIRPPRKPHLPRFDFTTNKDSDRC
jgi:hypothetical protein